MVNFLNDLRTRLRRLPGVYFVSAVAAALAFLDVLVIDVSLTALGLLLLAALPWLAPIIKSLKLPGGGEVEFRDNLARVEEEAGRVGLIAQPRGRAKKLSYMDVAPDDPNLALAGLRIEIETRLRNIFEKRDIALRKGTLLDMLKQLERRGILSPEESGVLRDLRSLLNKAVHGAKVDQDAANWAIEIGPKILAALDKRSVKGS